MIAPYPPEMERWVNALAAADAQVSDLIAQADGQLYLTAVARRVA